jgi:4-hydroxybenzoate polyprenyltransferase
MDETKFIFNRQRLGLYLDLIRWDRPAGWLLLLWPSLSALWIAKGGYPGLHLIFVFVIGTVLMRSAGCCINDVADEEFDRHVKRTANRPVTSGRVSVREAILLGVVLAFIAFLLVMTTNVVCVAWSFAALVVAIAYPYAKRFVSMPQAVLGIAFSFGIPMAFAAVNGGGLALLHFADAVPIYAWGLLMSNLFWVLAYDTEYAMVDRDDDLKIGIKTSAITLAKYDVFFVMFFYAVYLCTWWYLLDSRRPGVWINWSVILGAVQAALHYLLIRRREREGCFKAFRLNHWLGATLFAGVVLSYS